MKKVLLFATMAAVMASCSDDDSNNTSTGLTGTWKVTSLTSGVPLDINMDGNATTNLIGETGCYGNTKIVFGANNTVVLHSEEFTFDADTDDLTCEMLPAENGTYVQNGNTITVTVDGEVTELTKSGNTLTGVQEDEEWGTTTMVLTKQ